MTKRDIVVIGASLGGLRALRELCGGLPADFPAAVFVVWHTATTGPGVLPEILTSAGPLPATFARHGEAIVPGRIYVAPPDFHLTLAEGRVLVTQGPRENRFRPAIDPLFRSAAQGFGSRVIGVLLTGLLDDGTQGMWLMKRRGGVNVAQDPSDAEAGQMPASAIEEGVVDHVLPLAKIAELLIQLTAETVDANPQPTAAEQESPRMQDSREGTMSDLHPPGADKQFPQTITCPDCNGAIWLADDDQPLRYHCHVGHQFTAQGIVSAKGEELELALWTALRVLKEHAALQGSLAERAAANGREQSAISFRQAQENLHQKAQVVRSILEQSSDGGPAPGG